jgi:hypothetical protein
MIFKWRANSTINNFKENVSVQPKLICLVLRIIIQVFSEPVNSSPKK